MHLFYQTFPKVNALRAELIWTHYWLILKMVNKNVRKL